MTKTKEQKTQLNSGYALLLSVLAVTALTVSIAISLLVSGSVSSKTALDIYSGERAAAYADACAEVALQEIRDQTSFSGSGTQSFANGSCDFSVTNEGAQSRRIEAQGVSADSTRRVVVEVDGINPEITVLEWREAVSF